jgi:hypothetical protein
MKYRRMKTSRTAITITINITEVTKQVMTALHCLEILEVHSPVTPVSEVIRSEIVKSKGTKVAHSPIRPTPIRTLAHPKLAHSAWPIRLNLIHILALELQFEILKRLTSIINYYHRKN